MRGEKSREKRVRIETMSNLVARVKQWHDQFFALVSYLQSPFLLFVRLYWGFQLAQSGWGKLHHLRSEEHTSELQSHLNLLFRLLLAKQTPHGTARRALLST